MLPRELIKRLRRLELSTKRVVNEKLAGQYHSVFKGRGMTFEEVRLYQPGDEIRTIDWNVTARMDDVYVKLYREERELTVMLLVDLSASQELGSRGRQKAEVAAEIGAMLAFSAIKNNDRVGLILFTDRIERFVPPKKGRKHVMRIIAEILNVRPEGRGTNLAMALEHLSRVARRRSVTFLISDFIEPRAPRARDGARPADDSPFERALTITSKRHDLIPVALRDPLEEALPSLGVALIEDPETGERLRVDLASSAVREHFAKASRALREERQRLFKRLSLDSMELRAGDEYVSTLVSFFRARARRLASAQ